MRQLTRRFYFLHALLLTGVLFLSSACVPIPEELDEFEHNPSKKRELSELKKTYALFSRMEEIDVALHLNKRDFLSLVNDSFRAFSKHFVSLDAGEFSQVRFGAMKFHLSNQQLASQTEFSLQVDGLQREIYGHVMAVHTLEAASNRFVLNTDFDEIIVERIDGKNVVDKNSENLKLIEKASKNFMDTLNFEIINMPLNIPVDLNILAGVNGKDVFYAPDYKLHSAKSINMMTKMRMYLPYICKNGVVFLGSAKTKYSAELHREDLDIRALSHKLRSSMDAALQKSMGISLALLQEESSYYVSKEYLSKQMNFSLKEMDLRTINKFFLKLSEDEHNLSQRIYFSGKERLPSCTGTAKDCTKAQQSCNRNCARIYGPKRCVQCDRINNPFEKVRCMSDLEACKSKEEMHLYTCFKEEERCRLANLDTQNACQKENIALKAECEAKKERLTFTNDKIELAKLHLRFDVSNSYAIQRIRRIVFDKDLDGLEVHRNLHVSVDSSLQFALENAGIADINCSFSKGETLFVHSYADRVNVQRRVPVFTEILSDGTLMIKAKSRQSPMPISLEDSAYAKVHESEGLFLNCRYQNMPLEETSAEEILSSGKRGDLLKTMSGEITLTFEDEELSFGVSPVKIGEAILFYPGMQEKALRFSRQAEFE